MVPVTDRLSSHLVRSAQCNIFYRPAAASAAASGDRLLTTVIAHGSLRPLQVVPVSEKRDPSVTPTMKSAECLIIGGGPAGLSAALSVSRLLKSSIVLDSGVYRNACAENSYNIIGIDGTPPAVLRQCATAEIAKYGVASIVERCVQKVEKTEAGFRVDDEFEGKKLILATGAVDILPDIPGQFLPVLQPTLALYPGRQSLPTSLLLWMQASRSSGAGRLCTVPSATALNLPRSPAHC